MKRTTERRKVFKVKENMKLRNAAKRRKAEREFNDWFLDDKRHTLACIALQGILAACSSPQYYDRLADIAQTNELSVSATIAWRSYEIADEMIKKGKKDET